MLERRKRLRVRRPQVDNVGTRIMIMTATLRCCASVMIVSRMTKGQICVSIGGIMGTVKMTTDVVRVLRAYLGDGGSYLKARVTRGFLG